MSIQKKSLASGTKSSKKASSTAKARAPKGKKLASMKLPAHVVSTKRINAKGTATPASEELTFPYGSIEIKYGK